MHKLTGTSKFIARSNLLLEMKISISPIFSFVNPIAKTGFLCTFLFKLKIVLSFLEWQPCLFLYGLVTVCKAGILAMFFCKLKKGVIA